MGDLVDVARFLGIPSKDKVLASPFRFIEMLEKGLPLNSVVRIAEAVAPRDATFRDRVVPRATFARMKAHKRRLNKSQGELLVRLAGIWIEALRIWKTEEEARSFLIRRHPLLENERPLDLVLHSEIGAKLVREVLSQIRYGTVV